ncbi:cell adhesion molecule CEACAM3-like isoform X2 [Petromyzon marinus]|uniref:cell adhesion molecule CEACAM3-like isoform X2 n=1 Tax=Petromyzon marinus TaxID=7757 RepID=UPI003F728893
MSPAAMAAWPLLLLVLPLLTPAQQDCSVSLPAETIQKTPQGSVLFSAATTTPPRCQLALESTAWTVSPKADRGAHGWHGVRVASFNGSAIVEPEYLGKAWTYSEGTSNASLLVKNLTIYDSGYYTVTAVWRSPSGIRQSESTQPLSVRSDCRISMPRKPIQTEVGGSVLFSAQITAAPRCRLASVVWVKARYNDKDTTSAEAPLQVAAFNGSARVHPRYRGRAWLYGGNSSKSWLSVKSLTRYDSGFYLVTATWGSDEGEVQSESRQLLSVHYACEVRTQHASLRCARHETATLLCRARSPLCALEVVAWFRIISMQDRELILLHNGSDLSRLGPNYVGRAAGVRLLWSRPDDASLVLANVSLGDAGKYECQHEWRQGGGFEFSVADIMLTVTKDKITEVATSPTTKTTTTTEQDVPLRSAENGAHGYIAPAVSGVTILVLVLAVSLLAFYFKRAQRTRIENARDWLYTVQNYFHKHAYIDSCLSQL